jgi:hypothetical protein
MMNMSLWRQWRWTWASVLSAAGKYSVVTSLKNGYKPEPLKAVTVNLSVVSQLLDEILEYGGMKGLSMNQRWTWASILSDAVKADPSLARHWRQTWASVLLIFFFSFLGEDKPHVGAVSVSTLLLVLMLISEGAEKYRRRRQKKLKRDHDKSAVRIPPAAITRKYIDCIDSKVKVNQLGTRLSRDLQVSQAFVI